MENFFYYLISGLSLGAIFALVAVGYTLVYGIIKLINFAHSEFFMAGAYAGYGTYLLLGDNVSPLLAIPVIILASGTASAIIAVLTEMIAYKPIRNSGRLSALLTAIGVSILLQNMFAFVERAQPLQYPCIEHGSIGEIAQRTITIAGNRFLAIRFIYLVVAVLFSVVLWWITNKTRFGKAMRAVSQDAEAASLMGINLDVIIRGTFALGGFMAGVAGTLIGFQSMIEPYMGFMPGIKAFVAAVLGGIGNIPGAIIGGFIMGIIESMVVWIGVPTCYKDASALVVLILVLTIKPTGLLGKSVIEKV